ncbi:aminobenzoyl-glutamate utilization protein A [Lysinibacillus composti]|nr:amidohydrolase [Lysinibacillus composti]MBM7608143.1 aminobenzoyl-glutamate utilization protein A [Lysinibacillus composti]
MKQFTIPTNIEEKMIEWRRDFHRHPEVGWTEFRTASIIADTLVKLGFEISVGKEVVSSNRMGLPSELDLENAYQYALENGGIETYMESMKGGFTGVVAKIVGQEEGPTIAFRVDIDALPIMESTKDEHIPQQLAFRSIKDGEMHACGHDGHASIGLALATVLSQNREHIRGTIKIIFQPAEEGVRGAKSMVDAGVLQGVDYFLALHVGTGVPLGTVIAGTNGFLATTKIDAQFTGKAAHAGAEPEQGKNALLAAAQAILGLHSIARHSAGASRVNVGQCIAGEGRNIVPSSALLKLEVRGENDETHDYMYQQAINILNGAAAMYDVELSYDIMGAAKTCSSSDQLNEIIEKAALDIENVNTVHRLTSFAAGSEDATFMMSAVQEQGGLSTYSVFGTTLAAGHHHEQFDIDEKVMKIALDTWLSTIQQIYLEERSNE